LVAGVEAGVDAGVLAPPPPLPGWTVLVPPPELLPPQPARTAAPMAAMTAALADRRSTDMTTSSGLRLWVLPRTGRLRGSTSPAMNRSSLRTVVVC
jgi:hypothetical protein